MRIFSPSFTVIAGSILLPVHVNELSANVTVRLTFSTLISTRESKSDIVNVPFVAAASSPTDTTSFLKPVSGSETTKVTLFRLSQPVNAPTIIKLSFTPIVTDERFVQSSKAHIAIVSTPSEIVTFSSKEQSEKAPGKIYLTLPGIIISVSAEHSSNVFSPIDVTLSGIITDLREVHPENA